MFYNISMRNRENNMLNIQKLIAVQNNKYLFQQKLMELLWFGRIILFWTKSKKIPQKLSKSEYVDSSSSPICYILRTKSFIDLIILDKH